MSITAFVIYDDLWDMYFEGDGGGQSFSSQLSKAKLFATEECAEKARSEYCAGIKCEHYSIRICKLLIANKAYTAGLFRGAT